MRRALIPFLCLALTLPGFARAGNHQSVTTLGGTGLRTQSYVSEIGAALCLGVALPVGWSLSQPLVVPFADGPWAGQDIVFHLGQTDLYVLTLDGELLASHQVQTAHSWGTMTYVVKGDQIDPERDVLYITYGDNGEPRRPGVKAYRVGDLLPRPGERLAVTAVPLGDVNFTGRGIVSSPLYMGEDVAGHDRIVVGVVPDRVVVVKNLANNGGNPERIRVAKKDLDGWNSGTATRISNTIFAIAAGDERLPDGTVKRGGVYLMTVEGIDSRGIWHPDFENVDQRLEFANQGLSQAVLDQHDPYQLYIAEQSGKIYRVDLAEWAYDTLETPGFSNTGPASGSAYVYQGLRWEGSTTSTQTAATTPYGRLVAINKGDWSVAWSRALTPPPGAPPWERSWINVTPLVWQSKTDPSRQVILVGDAGGYLSAWNAVSEPEPLFLTNGLAPARCEEVESTDPSHRPAFTASARTQLTPTPHTTHGADAWHNTQGAATEMSVYAGRLFAGYNNASPHESGSSLLIFRAAANLAMGALTVKDENGPITTERLLHPGQKVQVEVPLYLEGDPLGGPQAFELAVGWETGRPVLRTVTLAPYERHVETVGLTVPDNPFGLRITAVANPALYATRRDHEAARGLLPPGLAGAPAPLPATWPAEWAAPAYGEAWVLDNARTWSQPYQCDLTIRFDSPEAGASVQRGIFGATVTVGRHGCGGLEAAPVVVDGLRQLARFGGNNEVTLRFDVFPEACGPFTITASVDPDGRINEVNEANNRVERLVAVDGCTPIQTECPPHVSPADCRGSKPTS